MPLWLIIGIIGALTYGIRLSFILLTERLVLPPLAQRALRFVPVAILTAIIAPALVLPAGTINVSLANARLVAGMLATVVAWRTRNIALTLVTGMGVLWALLALHWAK